MISRAVQAEDVICRRIGDNVVVIKENGRSIHVLNKTAAFIWEMCDGRYGIDEITAHLNERFDVSLEEARADVSGIIKKLAQAGIMNKSKKIADKPARHLV